MQLLRKTPFARKLGINPRTVDRKIDVNGPYYDPDFPKPVQIGPNAVGFVDEEGDKYIRLLCERRNGVEAKTEDG